MRDYLNEGCDPDELTAPEYHTLHTSQEWWRLYEQADELACRLWYRVRVPMLNADRFERWQRVYTAARVRQERRWMAYGAALADETGAEYADDEPLPTDPPF